MNKTNGLLEILDAPSYSIAEAARLTGLSKWRVSSYLRGYKTQYRTGTQIKTVDKPQIVEQSYSESTYASFLDIADLLIVKGLRRRNFSLQFLRSALEEAKVELGTPHFARSTFYTHTDEIILDLPQKGYMIKLLSGKQSVMPPIIEKLSQKLDFEDVTEFGFAQRFYPLGKGEPIVVDPQIAFGRPTITGLGIPTNNIYDLFLGEGKKIEPVSQWFEISASKVQTAVQFEHSLWG